MVSQSGTIPVLRGWVYPELLPQEKWLYVCLVRLCGKEGRRFLSLRYIAERTGFSLGVLIGSKKGGRPGMLQRLQDAGLLHAEIKKQVLQNGRPIQHAQFHITITDVWRKNEAFFSGRKCSDSEQSVDASKRSV